MASSNNLTRQAKALSAAEGIALLEAKRRIASGTAPQTSDDEGTAPTYFHGGVPGLAPGDHLHSATELGMQVVYNQPWFGAGARYNQSKVYVTSHLGTAIGYAARYLVPGGNRTPGWVYEVEPIGPVEPDPDYGGGARPDLASCCDGAVVVKVIERDVWLSEREQNKVIWPHYYWDTEHQIHAEDGTLLPSTQMVEHGVTQAYVDLLPKWIGLCEINGHGQMTVDGSMIQPEDVLARFDHLDLVDKSHIVKLVDRRARPNVLRCSCGRTFTDRYAAAAHKVDTGKLELIAERHQPEDVTPEQAMQLWVNVIAFRARSQWRWFWDHQE